MSKPTRRDPAAEQHPRQHGRKPSLAATAAAQGVVMKQFLDRALDKAIEKLGYIKPEAKPRLVASILDHSDQCLDAIARAHRKNGDQLTAAEKKEIGLRANAAMSREAFAELTEQGLENPLAAHAAVISRAVLSASRAQTLSDLRVQGLRTCEAVAPFVKDCPGCKEIDGQIMPIADVDPYGPPACFRAACAISFVAADVDEMLEKQPAVPDEKRKGWWLW